jgi:hypothetical protein
MGAPRYGDGEWPKGYGAEVKELAREIERYGVGTMDLPPKGGGPGGDRAHATSRVVGYKRSLSKIFGHPVETFIEHDDWEGTDFVAFSRVES